MTILACTATDGRTAVCCANQLDDQPDNACLVEVENHALRERVADLEGDVLFLERQLRAARATESAAEAVLLNQAALSALLAPMAEAGEPVAVAVTGALNTLQAESA